MPRSQGYLRRSFHLDTTASYLHHFRPSHLNLCLHLDLPSTGLLNATFTMLSSVTQTMTIPLQPCLSFPAPIVTPTSVLPLFAPLPPFHHSISIFITERQTHDRDGWLYPHNVPVPDGSEQSNRIHPVSVFANFPQYRLIFHSHDLFSPGKCSVGAC